MKQNNTNFIILVFLILIPTVSAETYRVFVDKEFGFFGVRSNNSTELIDYSNKTLYIDIGDKVEWENFVASDERVTIISENKLWNNTVTLGWNYKIYGYTFNKSGIYKFHLKENTIFREPENFIGIINSTIWFDNQFRIPIKSQKIVVGSVIISANPTPKKNKIVAPNIHNTIPENTEEEEYEIVPEVTTKIEIKIPKYEKYTILEILKSMFNR